MSKQQNKTPTNFFAYKLNVPRSSKSNVKKMDLRQVLTMDPQQTNPIYNHLRQSRNTQHILQFILGSNVGSKQNKKSQRRRLSYSTNFSVFQKQTRSSSSQQLQRFRNLGQNIHQNADMMTQELKKNKKKFSILGQYNNLVDRFCEVVPKIKTQTDKELFLAHHKLQKQCTQDNLPKDRGFVKRAFFFKNYQEPKIRLKVLKKKKKMAAIQKPQIVEFDDTTSARNNTIGF